MRKTILVVDDDVYIGDMLQETLSQEGYRVLRAYSGSEALLRLSADRPDLILLDLMLPGLNGEDILPAIKGIPVIVVSAKADVDDKVSLLLGGAADYVTKPFDMKELLARIEVQLRKSATGSTDDTNATGGRDNILRFDDIILDTDAHSVCVGEKAVKLTRTEYAILKLFMKNPSQVIPKSTILERISEDTPDCMENSLKVHISNLRRKLREAGGKDYIESVWGIGFKMT
ncbi:MAG: response regulator transcription factor [Bacillus sp. (in: Bacteria)]|nr:response regulator transcription factor [Bacillus sp. (in: firmicutes)]MCM1426857.1 response regulator transcription factor [Eubacterium sp.]